MDIAGLIQNYGYAALAAGAFLEGETVVILAGIAAYRAHLVLSSVMLVAAIAAFLGDQLFFYLGRLYGNRLLNRFPSVQARTVRAKALLQRHDLPLILSIRFMYGMRTGGLIAFGMSEVSPLKFLFLSAISASAWAVIVAGAGYLFGQTLMPLLAELEQYEAWILGAIVLCAALGLLLFRRARYRAPEK